MKYMLLLFGSMDDGPAPGTSEFDQSSTPIRFNRLPPRRRFGFVMASAS